MLGARYKYRNRKEKDDGKGKMMSDVMPAKERPVMCLVERERSGGRGSREDWGTQSITHTQPMPLSFSRREKGTFINEYKREASENLFSASPSPLSASLEQAERQGSFVTAAAGSVPIPTTKEEKRSSHPD